MNKKGITAILLVVIGLLILLLIMVGWGKSLYEGIVSWSNTYEKPKLNYDNAFLFNAQYVSINESADFKAKCSGTDNKYTCKPVKLLFYVNIKNIGSKMRVLYPNPIIDSCKGSNCQEYARVGGSRSCAVTPGTDIICEAGENEFNAVGTYRIYPAVFCKIDDPINGCQKTGISSPIYSYNKDSWIEITIQP